jgi:hypothetical protein
VVVQGGAFHDYEGFGRFGPADPDDQDAEGPAPFTAQQKGMPIEEVAGERQILSVQDGVVELDAPLPEGDVAYRVSSPDWPSEGFVATGWAGAPGFAFARVLVGADGRRMVPHFMAVDVASDNRLMPQKAWTSQHRFAATCDTPWVEAQLLYRPYPLSLARERGWKLEERIMAEARR